jgi:4-hydroxy-L-threonine phosphate dehydrogenase PdxA
MKSKPIIIVPGEPKSIFFEILFKSLKSQNFKSPLILITSIKILKLEMIKNKFKKKINFINSQNLVKNKLNNSSINLIDINYNSSDSNHYIKNCFDVAFKILKSGQTYKFINGPINKSIFLSKKFLGVTEYISKKFNIRKNAMLIFNKDLSVCPVTTHLPIKLVAKKISKKLIYEKISLINGFFKKNFGFKPKIAVTGLNPHCESILKFNEDKKIVEPAVKNLKKKGFNVFGPFSADTIFLKQNRKKYDVVLGMYHDQVLTPIKTLKEYDAINITLGLPFYRISPDHGPNKKMINKRISTPISLIKAIQFLDQR